jgi:hypothetical protein
MLTTIALLLLTRFPPNYEEKYITGCYENEDKQTCDSRHERWNRDIKEYEAEVAEYEASDLSRLASSKVTIEPAEGVAKIAPLKPTWCAGVKSEASFEALPRNLEGYSDGSIRGWGGLYFAAKVACKKPDDKEVQRFAGYVVQGYANATNASPEAALKNFTFRINEEKVKASKAALCSKLFIDDEDIGSKRMFGKARLSFFGCPKQPGHAESEPQWDSTEGLYGFEPMQYYLDTTSQPESELMRLSYLLDSVHTPEDTHPYKYSRAAEYAWLQHDMRSFDPAKALKELNEEPLNGNEYAALIVSESISVIKNRMAQYEAFVKKTAKDDDWKNILYVVPLKAAKDWESMAAKYKEAFDNSKAFEDKLFQPSLKAAKGCSPKLRADFTAFLKTIKVPAAEFENTVTNHPIGNLLLERIAACEAVDGNSSYSKALNQLQQKGRASRGPRLAAYYASLEAMGEVLKDRPKFPLDPKSLWAPRNANDMQVRASEADKSNAGYYGASEGSVVKSVSKTAKGTKITFVTERYQYMSQSCSATNRIKKIDSNGNLEYYVNCRDTGMKWDEKRVPDVVVPNERAGNITPGKWVDYASTTDDGTPVRVYSDKSKSKLVNWYGFAL